MDIKLLEKCFKSDNDTSRRIVQLCENIFYFEPEIDVFALTQKLDNKHYQLFLDILEHTRDKEKLQKLNTILRTFFINE